MECGYINVSAKIILFYHTRKLVSIIFTSGHIHVHRGGRGPIFITSSPPENFQKVFYYFFSIFTPLLAKKPCTCVLQDLLSFADFWNFGKMNGRTQNSDVTERWSSGLKIIIFNKSPCLFRPEVYAGQGSFVFKDIIVSIGNLKTVDNSGINRNPLCAVLTESLPLNSTATLSCGRRIRGNYLVVQSTQEETELLISEISYRSCNMLFGSTRPTQSHGQQ